MKIFAQFTQFWVFVALLELYHLSGVESYGDHVCIRPEMVTYKHQVYKSKIVPYQKHSFWRGWQTQYRHEYGWENEVRYKMENRQFCCSGYEVRNSLLVSVCVPVCREGCGAHSFCAEPGKCDCIVGYTKLEGSTTTCEPVCDPPCGSKSHCQEPDVCVCEAGYQSVSAGEPCSPVCREGCGSHSTCISPDVCQCDEGYSLEGNECQPICSKGCPTHGKCMLPDVCTCDPGYLMKGDHCEPRCSPECSDYAHCVSPDLCECYPGYEKTVNGSQCVPKCSKGCPNGFCFSPEVCVCNIGHLMGPDQTCEPQCSLKCAHGRCTQPETCTCDPGYRFGNGSQHVCEPVCENGCLNGDCVAPDVCICHVGFQPSGNHSVTSVCLPVCETECVNGSCSAPGQCSCLEGYIKISGSESSCTPNCGGKCEFGQCLAPERCQCWEGYEMTKDGCQKPKETTTEQNNPSSTSVTSADFLHLQDLSCGANCSCWTEFDEEGILSTSNCARICHDEMDKSCRNLSDCHCDPNGGHLICNNSGDEDYSSEETRYVCKVPKVVPQGAEATTATKPTQKAATWVMVIAWCSGIIVLVAGAVAIYIFYRRMPSRYGAVGHYSFRRRTGQTPMDPIEERIYENAQ
ncbi:multiple epidermal growth factor-like domains protein 11 isoform X2 [Drosophila bipectinata]|uniref:multiple epidermal growth factor-like domains protein 11 isoform X2 n=1 Tax=Drosophila bipectinata TaxID=42026 RepID=UPI001C88E62B|nr:tenascin [Drosophila bipectinata]